MIDLDGQVAVVTGSSRGIGAGIARVLAGYGASVVVNYVSSSELAADVVRHILALGSEAIAVKADVTKPTDVAGLVAEATDAFGGIDILVNNAGHNHLRPILEIADEQWDDVIRLNLTSCFLTSKAVLPHMLRGGGGRIVNISSISGQRGGLSGDVDYSAAKAGILGFTRSLARWAAPQGVLVNAIALGYVETGWQDSVAPEHAQKILEGIPLGRFAEVEEVGEIVAFLCGPGGGYLVGETITANGGAHMD